MRALMKRRDVRMCPASTTPQFRARPLPDPAHCFFTALKGIIENDKKYYPETTRHAFVVNAPGIVTVAWNFLSPILDARTRDKIQIMGSNYQPTLLKAIEPANLPTWLGGECDCKGGCVP